LLNVVDMGANNTKAIYLCETIYPSADGTSIIPPEKLQKAIQKGEIPAPNTDEEDVDDDEDEKIDRAIQEVWNYYDKKNQGFITKKVAQQFFKDALELFALRKGCKSKDLLGAKSLGSALEESYRRMDSSGTGQVTFKVFEEFINENDIDEALAIITGSTEPIEISTSQVQMVDTSTIVATKKGADLSKIEYRDYPEDD
jgi:hypothetical protein